MPDPDLKSQENNPTFVLITEEMIEAGAGAVEDYVFYHEGVIASDSGLAEAVLRAAFEAASAGAPRR